MAVEPLIPLGVGRHRIQAERYHQDPCPAPSLSSSIARLLIASSPLHAWTAHPRLNPAWRPQVSDKFDLGTVAHAYLLEGAADFVIVEAADWKTKAAQEARDKARSAGKTALLAEQWTRVQAMKEAAQRQLDAYQDAPRPFKNGTAEETLVWQEPGGVWCRARLDFLHADGRICDDLKTSWTANPTTWGRTTLWGGGYDIQAAFYLRGLKAVLGKDAAFRFVVIEAEPPYALSVIGLDPQGLELGARKVQAAIRDWRECLETDRWPGYPQHCCFADVPPWEAARWEAREFHGRPHAYAAVVDDGRDISEQLFGDRG